MTDISKEHLFIVNSEHFDVSFNEKFKAMQFTVKEDLYMKDKIKTGVISLSHKNYAFMYPINDLPLITAPVDSGYLGDISLITSRPITLPKGFTFYLMELKKSTNEFSIPEDMKLRKPAYKGDIGQDAYSKSTVDDTPDIQIMLENSTGKIFFPRSSAAKKGYEVHVNNQYTTIRKTDLGLITRSEAYSVIQLVRATVSKFSDPVMFIEEPEATELLNNLKSTSERGEKAEGSSDGKKTNS